MARIDKYYDEVEYRVRNITANHEKSIADIYRVIGEIKEDLHDLKKTQERRSAIIENNVKAFEILVENTKTLVETAKNDVIARFFLVERENKAHKQVCQNALEISESTSYRTDMVHLRIDAISEEVSSHLTQIKEAKDLSHQNYSYFEKKMNKESERIDLKIEALIQYNDTARKILDDKIDNSFLEIASVVDSIDKLARTVKFLEKHVEKIDMDYQKIVGEET